MTPPALRLSGIAKRFGATLALDGASLEVQPGEVMALVGENGAGKSTLLSIVGGLLAPESGRMEVAGGAYAPRSPRDARAAGIALIHQELSLFPHLTVAENVLMGIEPARRGLWDRAEARRATAAALLDFGHPEVDPDALVGGLPIGARQVVEICRAIAARARVVLMDEPTSSLPRGDVERLFAVVKRLAAAGVAVVYISHFLEETRAVASAYTVLRDGRTVGAGSLADTPNDRVISMMVGRSVGELFPRRSGTPSDQAALEVEGLSAPGLDEASFALRRGEVLGVFGLMGSGRTEMVRALFGLAPVRAGRIARPGGAAPRRDARPDEAPRASRARPAERLRDGLGYLSEDRKGEGLALPMSVADNVTLTRLSTCARGGVLDLARQRAQAATRAGEAGVRMRGPGQPVRTLSGGNQQKVAFARLLHQEADVLLLDEPTRGVDVASKAALYRAIVAAADAGRAVLMVSSYVPELLGVCDRVAVMSRGRLSPARPARDWTPESMLEAAIGS
jgi:ribose transport system ATP-binding protein